MSADKYTAWQACQQQLAAKLIGPGYELPGIQTDFPASIVLADVSYDEEKRKAAIAAGLKSNHRFDEELFDRLKSAFEHRWVQM